MIPDSQAKDKLTIYRNTIEYAENQADRGEVETLRIAFLECLESMSFNAAQQAYERLVRRWQMDESS